MPTATRRPATTARSVRILRSSSRISEGVAGIIYVRLASQSSAQKRAQPCLGCPETSRVCRSTT